MAGLFLWQSVHHTNLRKFQSVAWQGLCGGSFVSWATPQQCLMEKLGSHHSGGPMGLEMVLDSPEEINGNGYTLKATVKTVYLPSEKGSPLKVKKLPFKQTHFQKRLGMQESKQEDIKNFPL